MDIDSMRKNERFETFLYSLARGCVEVLKVKYNLLPDLEVVDIGHSLYLVEITCLYCALARFSKASRFCFDILRK